MEREQPDRLSRIIRSHGYKIYFLIFMLNLLWNGFCRVDSFARHVLTSEFKNAKNPFAFNGSGNYLQEAPLYFILAHWVGATTPQKYLLFCGAAILLAHAIFLILAVRTLGREDGILASLLFVAHPITYILNTWIGMVDPLTVICTTVVLFARGIFPVLIASALSTFNHPSTTFIVPSVLLLRFVATSRDATVPMLVAGGTGIVIGKFLCRSVWMMYTFPVYTRWDFFVEIPWKHWLKVNFSHFSIAVYSFAFALWIPLVIAIASGYNNSKKFIVCYAIVILGLYGVTFLTLDTTRVFAVLSWAPTLYMLISFLREPSPGPRPFPNIGALVRWCALLGWLAPHLFVWDGRVYSAGLTEMLFTTLSHKLWSEIRAGVN
jgi:hypothetical protein